MQGKKPDCKKEKDNEGRQVTAPSKVMLGILVFVVSGAFHELLIASMFRKVTLENLTFFTLHGIAVWVQLTVRSLVGWTRQDPHGLLRVLCIGAHLMFLAVTGRFFLAPYLRYYNASSAAVPY